ncbi:MAG: tRNA (adenosine(37)-N6)-dimethylallyltransferase MiaA [Bacteroidetes bacterium]|nr:tRNA (adenosine(37)-N6)-dimethylallyltransferase MiaA [Bacteroidota bacterium]HET6245113.1 tRNA (adenosine(37)-N6)-dimethylallyltransferase MiaA [Bacteroidia bacterium]
MLNEKKLLIVLLGPTAVGKTDLSIELARDIGTVILSADSRQLYKELNIGTAKPTAIQLNSVKHYFIDTVSIANDYDAATFEKDAISLLKELFKTQNAVILTGGSGLYINAVCNGFDILPASAPEIREQLNEMVLTKGLNHLTELLNQKDPEYYKIVDLKNPQRLIRALEVCLSSGRPYSSFRTQKSQKRDFQILYVGINRRRDELYERINLRVDEMVKEGLVEEVRGVLAYKKNNALQTVGYKELINYFVENIDLQQAIMLIKQNTRRYAKRQLTWFRKNKEITWFDAGDKPKIFDFIKRHINQ